jgi:hypothetical protein
MSTLVDHVFNCTAIGAPADDRGPGFLAHAFEDYSADCFFLLERFVAQNGICLMIAMGAVVPSCRCHGKPPRSGADGGREDVGFASLSKGQLDMWVDTA